MRKPTGRYATGACRVTGVLAAIALLGLVVLRAGCSKAEEPQPNVILLMVDTLRADHLGYGGYERETSPNLDEFVAGATAFMNHYSHASRTGPSVASLLTSLHVRSHGVVNPLGEPDGKGVLEESRTTLAEMLSAGGYTCRAIVSNPNVQGRYGFAQGYERFEGVAPWTDAGVINDRAVQWIDQMKAGPFFLYLHYMEPHSSYNAPAIFQRLFVDPHYSGPITGSAKQVEEILCGNLEVTPEDEEHLAGLYDQEVRCWDDRFGEFVRALKERRVLENTVIVIVADHGEEFFEHGSVFHGLTLYGEQLHVPLVIRAPGLAPRRISTLTRNIDVVPTVLELAHVPASADLQGRSLVPLMNGKPGEDLPVFSEAGVRGCKTAKRRSFQTREWKYVETFIPNDYPRELYHLLTDPNEQNNLFTSRGDVAEQMMAMLEEFLQDVPEGTSRSVTLDKEEIERLRALGYAGGD